MTALYKWEIQFAWDHTKNTRLYRQLKTKQPQYKQPQHRRLLGDRPLPQVLL